MRAYVRDSLIRVSFRYHPRLVDRAREIPDRSFDKQTKEWTCPATPWHAHWIAQHFQDFELSGDMRALATRKEDVPRINTRTLGALYPYQLDAVRFIEKAGGRCIVADAMGLGKTIEFIGWVKLHPEFNRVVVVAPTNAIFNWAMQIKTWTGEQAGVIETKRQPLPTSRWWILSYTMMTLRYAELIGVDAICFDEGHALKNRKAQRTRAARSVIAGVRHVIFMSGTPFLNRPSELFQPLNMLNPIAWRDFFPFAKRYCDGHLDLADRWVTTGASNREELRDRLRSIMIRREKSEVAKDLPPKTRTFLPVEIDNRTTYTAARRETVAYIREHRSGKDFKNHLDKINSLRGLVGLGKVAAAVEWATDFLESTDDKLVIYAHHLEAHRLLAERLASFGVVRITGKETPRRQFANQQEFQMGKARVMLLSEAGGQSIDLFAASDILFVEREWTPAREEQIEDRLHRHGQKNPVSAVYLTGRSTIDQKFDSMVESKRQVFADIVGQDEVKRVVLEELFDYLKEEK